MESLGKSHDLDGNLVNQGIAVYGNKGSTDQHAYVQQLRDGVNNFFATFIEIGRARSGPGIEVDPGTGSGDYLQGFLRGTRAALAGQDRESMTLSISEVDAFHVGALIALYERAVGYYASLVNINAYHQPGVEAGKKAAGEFLSLLTTVRDALKASSTGQTADTLAASLSADRVEYARFHFSPLPPMWVYTGQTGGTGRPGPDRPGLWRGWLPAAVRPGAWRGAPAARRFPGRRPRRARRRRWRAGRALRIR
jgi:hypothetical protein